MDRRPNLYRLGRSCKVIVWQAEIEAVEGVAKWVKYKCRQVKEKDALCKPLQHLLYDKETDRYGIIVKCE